MKIPSLLTTAGRGALALVCSTLMLTSVASAQIVAEWNWGANPDLTGIANSHPDHVQLSGLSTDTTVGTITNRIGNTPIANGLIDAGTNVVNDIVGSLNFVQQLATFDIPNDVPDAGQVGGILQYRLRRQDSTLNPEIDANYTQLYWIDTAPTALASLNFSLGVKNNDGFADVRAAIQDTNGDWHLSQTVQAAEGRFDLDLDLDNWAPYTAATAASTSLELAPLAGYVPFAGQAQAFGFFLQDNDSNTASNKFRIADFAVTVPEPGTLALAGLGVLGLVARRRR